ncbi:MAG TPA: nickel-responsive transcriptional regulator NikR [Candidatus Omnitrophota bacterium]|nr:nickel-responsive transcriptional regulator NikR [Candidatus Omnitrophota bacterium]HPD84540.1 nickel-responsive transcriptional regulator NikR [Candidatus Omnitrophota bacterium]HRZ03398.1 nickel-responsive transcriptional regulator NikR [Candidatus Omnitrophota bacterium]
MAKLIRFGVSFEKELFTHFDRRIKEKGYTNRSEAIRDLIRNDLVDAEWQSGKEVAGAITLVYDHHHRDLLNRLMDIQHDYHANILSTQHVHLDHHNCLEVVVAKGDPQGVQDLYGKLKSLKGVKHASIAMSTMGKTVA